MLRYFATREGESSSRFPDSARFRLRCVIGVLPDAARGEIYYAVCRRRSSSLESPFSSNYPSEGTNEIVGMLRQVPFMLATRGRGYSRC